MVRSDNNESDNNSVSYTYRTFLQGMDVIKNKAACEYFANVEKNKTFQLLLKDWDKITEVLDVLQIPYDVTMALQNSAFTLSDFFLSWVKMNLKLNNVIQCKDFKTNFAQTFRQFLNQRKQILLDHPLMLCAIYMDPRVRFELKEENLLTIAKLKLADLYERVQQFKKDMARELEDQLADEDEPVTVDLFDEYVKTLGISFETDAGSEQEPTGILSRGNFLLMLENFEEKTPVLHHQKSILQFWESQENCFRTYTIWHRLSTPYHQRSVQLREHFQFWDLLSIAEEQEWLTERWK